VSWGAADNRKISKTLPDTYQKKFTYYIACFQVSPSKLLTAAAMLKTRDANQNELTASLMCVPVKLKENWRVVAVTAEKKVATVDRLSLEKN
jgi:hypothetical protein